MKTVEGNLVDVENRKIYPCTIIIEGNRIISIQRNSNSYNNYILPGFVDAHVHIESSMLVPTEFSNAVVPNGTVAVVNDPHEIANVLGMSGIKFMMDNSQKASLKFFYGIPSCVPATAYDRSGSIITSKVVENLASTDKFIVLSEMMNIPGVLQNDPEVVRKLDIARKYKLKIDGHAPKLRGDSLSAYIARGIETDHESISIEEAGEKISKGMKIIIREGSAAKNYEALKSLIGTHTDDVMFCTDDAHPDDLLRNGHINHIVKKALSDGFGIFDVLQVACINPVKFYHLNVGILKEGDYADFILVDDIVSMNILSTYINGEEVYSLNKMKKYEHVPVAPLNYFNHDKITSADIVTVYAGNIPLIKIVPDEIVTRHLVYSFGEKATRFESDISTDVLKIAYVNRYTNGKPQLGLITGVGLNRGAFASSVSHDSHNIIAIGCTDNDLTAVINAIIENKGGLAVQNGEKISILPLPVGGIMSDQPVDQVTDQYLKLNRELKQMGCILKAPFMTLSFMSLIVIPSIKIGEKGIFDYDKFDFI